MSVTAGGLVAVLVRAPTDFEDSCQKASLDVLRAALAILIEPDPPDMPQWIVERAKWGARFIERRLASLCPASGDCFQPAEPEWDYWHWTPYWPIYRCDPPQDRIPREAMAIPGGIWPHPCSVPRRD